MASVCVGCFKCAGPDAVGPPSLKRHQVGCAGCGEPTSYEPPVDQVADGEPAVLSQEEGAAYLASELAETVAGKVDEARAGHAGQDPLWARRAVQQRRGAQQGPDQSQRGSTEQNHRVPLATFIWILAYHRLVGL